MSAEESGSMLGWLRRIYDSLRPIGIKGADGITIASVANPVPVDATFTGTLSVDLDHADDDVLVYGNDGTTDRKIKTDAAGELQVDVLTLPAISGTVDTELPTAAALSDASANPTAPAVGAFNMFWDVVSWRRWFGALVADGFGAVYAPFVNAFVHMRDAAGARVELRGDSTGVFVGSQSVVKKTITLSSSGDTTVHTPTGSNKVRLYFFGYSAGSSVSGVLIGLKLAGYNSSAVFDNQYLVAAGQPYARNIQGGKRYIEGSAGGVLTANLSAAQTVYCNIEIEEVP